MRGRPRHAALVRVGRFLTTGTVRGRLLDLGRYPGLVDGRARVHGELYLIARAELLPVLDREEGYNFQRRRIRVTLTDGGRVRAWIYAYRGPRARAVAIPESNDRRVRWR